MTPFIGKILDDVIIIIVGVISISFYFNKNFSKHLASKFKGKFDKLKVLLLIIGIISIIRGSIGIASSYAQNSQLPSKEKFLDEISKKEANTKDFIYTSPKGYRILIPKGYTYIIPNSGDISLILKSNMGGVSVSNLENSQRLPLQEFVQGVLDYLKETNSSYTFSRIEEVSPNIFRVLTKVIKKGYQMKAVFIYTEKRNIVYQLNLGCVEDYYDSLEGEFTKIINSFELT